MPRIPAPPDATGKTVTTKTVTTEQIPLTPEPEKEIRAPFWDYMNTLTPDDWKFHDVYLYRAHTEESRAKGRSYLEIFLRPFAVPEIKEKFGGGGFEAMMHKGTSIIYNERFSIEGPPKYSNAATTSPAAADSGIGPILQQLVDALKTGPENAQAATEKILDMQSEAYKRSLSTIASAVPTNQGLGIKEIIEIFVTLQGLLKPAAPPANDMQSKLLDAALARLLNPPNPVEQIGAYITAMKEFGLDKGTGKADIWDRAAGIAEKVVDNLGAITALGKVAPPTTANLTPAAPANGNGTTPPANSPAAPPVVPVEAQTAILENFLKMKFCELYESQVPPAFAYDWLETMWPELLQRLAQFQPAQIKAFCTGDPVLQRIATHPGFLQFMAEMLAADKEEPEADPAAKPPAIQPAA